MSIRTLTLFTAAAVLTLCAVTASADTLKFVDGRELEGVIKKVEAGKVSVAIGNEEKVFDILEIESMDFNTPHLLLPASKVPIDHFLKSFEAQEIVRNVEELDRAAADIRKKLGQIRTYWAGKEPIEASDVGAWHAAKEEFRKPLDRYQELLNDLYFHVLARVDEYNLMGKQASKVYVGVKGIRAGSPLVTKDMEKLPLKKYVPATWYDTIFYNGYDQGYSEAYVKYTVNKPQ